MEIMSETRKRVRYLVFALFAVLAISAFLTQLAGGLVSSTSKERSGKSALAPPIVAAGVRLTSLETDLIRRLNAERATAGLSDLVVDANLVQIARIRSSDMATSGYFSHTSPEGQTAFTLLDQWGIPYHWAGENLARNNYPVEETVGVAIRGLMASPSHRFNILYPNYNRVGVGYAEDGSGMRFYTIVFVD
jgi:uncharacterized protein YkwD